MKFYCSNYSGLVDRLRLPMVQQPVSQFDDARGQGGVRLAHFALQPRERHPRRPPALILSEKRQYSLINQIIDQFHYV